MTTQGILRIFALPPGKGGVETRALLKNLGWTGQGKFKITSPSRANGPAMLENLGEGAYSRGAKFAILGPGQPSMYLQKPRLQFSGWGPTAKGGPFAPGGDENLNIFIRPEAGLEKVAGSPPTAKQSSGSHHLFKKKKTLENLKFI